MAIRLSTLHARCLGMLALRVEGLQLLFFFFEGSAAAPAQVVLARPARCTFKSCSILACRCGTVTRSRRHAKPFSQSLSVMNQRCACCTPHQVELQYNMILYCYKAAHGLGCSGVLLPGTHSSSTCAHCLLTGTWVSQHAKSMHSPAHRCSSL